jgi:uncharacterized small protein (DUF1192 family)
MGLQTKEEQKKAAENKISSNEVSIFSVIK